VSLFGQQCEPTTIYYNNKNCIELLDNPSFHDQSKHIDIKCHFILVHIWTGAIKLRYIFIDEKVVDILMKSLMKEEFLFFKDKMGVVKKSEC